MSDTADKIMYRFSLGNSKIWQKWEIHRMCENKGNTPDVAKYREPTG
jgi:hypothetical protein